MKYRRLLCLFLIYSKSKSYMNSIELKKKEIDKCQSLFYYVNKCFGVLVFYPPKMVFSPTTNTASKAIEIVVMVNHTNTNVLLSTILFGAFINYRI